MENKVIVRVWTSSIHESNQGDGVGHVSVEIVEEKEYISLWPTSASNATACWHSYDEDLIAEQRLPEYCLVFYGLDIDKMSAMYDQQREKIKKWNLMGNNRVLGDCNANSCSGVVYSILKVGGIEDYLTQRDRYNSYQSSGSNYSPSLYGDCKSTGYARSTESYTFYYAIPPDQLSDRLIRAKQEELVLMPQTQNFEKVHNETDVNEIKGNQPSGSCVIL